MNDLARNGWALETEELLSWNGTSLARLTTGYHWSQPPWLPRTTALAD